MHAVARTDRSEWRGFGIFLVWGLVYLAARLLLELPALSWRSRLLVSLAPTPLFAWVLWTIARGVADMDELQRRIQLEALAFAFPLTLLLVMTLGLLEIAIGLNPNDWSYRHVWPMLFVLYLAGLVRAKRRYA